MEMENDSCVVVESPCEVEKPVVLKWKRLLNIIVLPVDERGNEIILQVTPKYELEPGEPMIENKEKDQNNPEHFPAFTIGISIIQVIFYSVFNDHWLTLMIGYDPHRRHEIWRYFTASLVHSSVSHLYGNLVMQLILGVLLEIVHRWKCVAIIYWASCAGGTLFANICDKTEYTVGASAGAVGLLFSLLSTILFNWNNMDYKKSRLFCVLLYIIWIICQAVFSEALFGQNSNISHAGHFGGAVAGFLVSTLVLKPYKKQSWQKTKQWICAVILIIILVVVFLINVTSSRYPPNEWNFSYKETFQKYAAIHYNATDKIDFPVFRNVS